MYHKSKQHRQYTLVLPIAPIVKSRETCTKSGKKFGKFSWKLQPDPLQLYNNILYIPQDRLCLLMEINADFPVDHKTV